MSLLDLEAQRLQRIGDDAGQPRGVEQALLEVELPAAVLLRHQPALQLVGEPRDGAREALELLVEQGAELVELVGRAELGGLDDLVELLGEDLVVELVHAALGIGAGRRRVRRVFAGLGGLRRRSRPCRPRRLRCRRSRRCRRESGPPRRRSPRSRLRPARASCRCPRPSRAPGRRRRPRPPSRSSSSSLSGTRLRSRSSSLCGAREQLLVLEVVEQRRSMAAGPLRRSRSARDRRWRCPRAALSRPAIFSRSIRPSASASGASPRSLTSAKLARNSRSSSISEMLPVMPGMRTQPSASTRACSSASNAARACGSDGARLRCVVGIVAREPHRHGVALAAGDRDVAPRRQPRQVGEPRLVGGEDRPVGREGHLELALAPDRAHGRAHRGLEDRGGVGPVRLALGGLCHSRLWF